MSEKQNIARSLAINIKRKLIELKNTGLIPNDLNKLYPDVFHDTMNCVDEMESLLRTLRQDAEMALNDDWDRSDEGFISQIELIDRLLDQPL